VEYKFIYNNWNFNLKNTKVNAPLNFIEMLNFCIKKFYLYSKIRKRRGNYRGSYQG